MTDVLAGLSDEQRRAAETLDGPVLIKAGPGSGKTRTITHRIAHAVRGGHHDPARTLAVTFTARAAGELHARLAQLGAGGVAVRTFHSAALRQLRHFWGDAIGGTPPRIDTDRAGLLGEAARQASVSVDRDRLTALTTELDWLKANCLTADQYAEQAHGRDSAGLSPADVSAVLLQYEQVKSERSVMDFDDVLLVTVGLLSSRSDLREQVRRAFRWFTVDEYQDVSPLQQRLLDLWVGDRNQICVVGDAAQTIYQFAGADPRLLADFPRRFPGAAVIELTTTYRCAPAIAAAANRLGRDLPGALRLRSSQPDPGRTRVLNFPTEAAEARGVADEIAGLVRSGQSPTEVACLYRIHQQGRALQDELRRREVPFSTRGGDRFFDRPEVREALTRYRGELRVQPEAAAPDIMVAVLAAMGHEATPPDSPGTRERWESLAALAALFPPGTTGAQGLGELQQRAVDNQAPPPAGVSLLTLHAAKGLEWDTVFIVGAGDTYLPYVRAESAEALREEQRLAYVGFTRAQRRLVASWPTETSRGARQEPSPYLAALDATGAVHEFPETTVVAMDRDADPEDRTGTGLPPAPCSRCGRALVTGRERVLGHCDSCSPPVDERLVTELTTWRDSTAAAAGLPGHAVLTDATVRAIAERIPDAPADLADIPGMWPSRIAEHGAAILAIVAGATADPRP